MPVLEPRFQAGRSRVTVLEKGSKTVLPDAVFCSSVLKDKR